MAAKPKWISPSAAMDMLYTDPAGSDQDYGFALLRPRARNRDNKVADLARAKLQPRAPSPAEQPANGG